MASRGQPRGFLFPRFANSEGENNWYGDEISTVKNPENTRIMYHNVNGLPLNGTDGFDMFIHAQEALQVDVQCFSEHCLDTTKHHVCHRAREILRTTYKGQSMIQFNSSSEEAMNQYKPGGTGILLLGNLVGQLEPNGRGGDTMGRWSFIHLRRRNLPPVTILSVYQVCPRPTNVLGNTAYHQQVRALHMEGRTLHPRKAFIEDLNALIKYWLQNNHDLIIGGDFNEALEDKNAGALLLATTHQLVDPFLSRHQTLPPFGTYLNGKQRIDIVLVTPRLLGAIQAIGYGPFDHATRSDHRPLLIDFDTRKLFGQHIQDLPSPSSRGVRTKDISTVRKFVEHTYSEIQRRQGFTFQQRLDDNSAPTNIAELVDEIVGTSEDLAESKCRRRRAEFYSQALVKQRFTVSILKGHLNALKQGKDRTMQLRAKMNRVGIDVVLPISQRLTNQALQEAREKLRVTVENNFEARQLELEEKIQAASIHGEQRRKKILSSIKKVEQAQQTYRTIKTMRQSHGGMQQIDRIEVPASWPPSTQEVKSLQELEDPKQCQEWRLITNPQDVEYYIMLRNRLHFGQAQGTPFTIPPISEEVDWAATTESCEQLLHGAYPQRLVHGQCQELLRACKARSELDAIPCELTKDEFYGKLKVWRENTTTSPSGRHLGRYKALLVRIPPDPDAEEDFHLSFEQKQDAIASLKLSLINYCIRNSYVLTRWQQVVNIMIFKEPGMYKIHRLRVIHIYEADFNLILAIKWRQLLRHAEKSDIINKGQYGGRPGCEAQSLTLLEELKYDLAYLTRRTLFNFDNDATSCYDRIIVPLASLINRKYGLHHKIVTLHAHTLRLAQFRLKTAAGISELHYSHCKQFPIHGTGQGSGNSPCIWLFISSTLFDIHENQANGVKFVSPDGTKEVSFSMVGFVDDSTGSCNDFQPSTQAPLSQLFKMMESDAQRWNDLLYESGGKLELTKCSFHVLHFSFLPNGRPKPALDRFDNHIHILDRETQSSIAIPAKRAFEPHKTLGHQKSPYTPTTSLLHQLQEKAHSLATLIATSPITRQGAHLAYHTIFLPSIKYTLPQSFYSRQALESAQAPSLGRIIAKCGYNRNTARELIYAPTDWAGGGFLPWHLLQGEGQTLQFLKHWRTNTIISATLRIATAWAQWQSGHDRPIFEDTKTPLPYLESRWLSSLRTFLSTIGAQIILDEPGIASPERENDIHIMSYARTCGLFDDDDLRIINYCRLHLHVTTVSELLDAGGTTIIPSLFHCRREPWFNPKTYITIQQRPSDYHVKTQWQRLCRQWITSEGKLAASIHLGKWLVSGEKQRRRRQTYITCCSQKTVYHWRYGNYWKYRESNTNSHVYLPVQVSDWQPVFNCIPVTAYEHAGGYIVITARSKTGKNRNLPSIPQTFEEYAHQLPSWERALITNINFKFEPFEICHRLHTEDKEVDLILVSDGSQTHKGLTYGWVLGTVEGTTYAEHSGSGTGTMTSHRAEAWGMLSCTLFLLHLERYTLTALPTPAMNLTILTDNAGLIQRIQQRKGYAEPYPNATLEADWDLVEQIHTVTCKIRSFSISYEWVKGHQDQDGDAELDEKAKFNIRADQLATEFHQLHSVSTEPFEKTLTHTILPSERCRLVIGERSIHGHYISEIRQAYNVPPLKLYLARRHGWSTNVEATIDWEVLTRAAKNSSITNVQLLKLVHEKLPTRYEQAKSKMSSTSKCHYCEQEETFTHLTRCTNPISTQFREHLQEQLEQYFMKTSAPDRFRELVFDSQVHWLYPPTLHDQQTPFTNPCFQEQSQIGWHLVSKGFISKEWRKVYEVETAQRSEIAHCNSVDFVAGVLRTIWKAQLHLWETHNQELNKANSSPPSRILDKAKELKHRIRHLHDQRPKCHHSHQEHYFYDDLDAFLETATCAQMKQYLHLYEPAIRRSIQDAKQSPIRSIFTFPGFTHWVQQPRAPKPKPPNIPRHHTGTSQTDKRGSLFIHKHTRWKAATQMMKSIRDYFHSSPSP